MTLAALYLYAAGAVVFYGATPLARFASRALGLRARYWWVSAEADVTDQDFTQWVAGNPTAQLILLVAACVALLRLVWWCTR